MGARVSCSEKKKNEGVLRYEMSEGRLCNCGLSPVLTGIHIWDSFSHDGCVSARHRVEVL